MTFWAKLLTVVVLVLAIVFAGISAVLFAKKTEWRKAYEQQAEDLGNEIKQRDQTISTLENNLNTVTAERDKLRTEKRDLVSAVDGLNQRIKTLETANQKNADTIDTLNAQLNLCQGEQKKAANRYEKMRAERNQLQEDVKALTGSLHAAENKVQDLTKEKHELTETLQSTRETLQALKEDNERFYQMVSELRPRYPHLAEYFDKKGMIPVKRIIAKVVAVDPTTDSVIINAGRNAGVKKEYKFLIHRGDQFIGQMIITDLPTPESSDDDLAAGKIEFLAKDEQGNPFKVKVGDDAVSDLGL